MVELIFSRNVEGDRAVSTVSVLFPQNAFSAPLFSDIGIFGIFATESSSPDTIYWFEVPSDFLQLSKWWSLYSVYKKLFSLPKSRQNLIFKLDIDRCILEKYVHKQPRFEWFWAELLSEWDSACGRGQNGVKGVVSPLGFPEGFFQRRYNAKVCIFMMAVMQFFIWLVILRNHQ